MMLTPDEQLALDILDALDSRYMPELDPALNVIGKDERCRLEQQYRMLEAMLDWLERWMANPEHNCLQGDPLWQTVTTLYHHLTRSQGRLLQRAEEIDEATRRLTQARSKARPVNSIRRGVSSS